MEKAPCQGGPESVILVKVAKPDVQKVIYLVWSVKE